MRSQSVNANEMLVVTGSLYFISDVKPYLHELVKS